MRAALVILLILAASIGAAYYVLTSSALKEARMGPQDNKFILDSPAFTENGDMPTKFTCKGENVSPPLEISGVPDGIASLALIMHDPDAPGGDWLHWSVWNISTETKTVSENSVPAGAIQGISSFGDAKYGGPCPPSGTHRYVFELYALKSKLSLHSGATKAELQQALKNEIIAQTKLVGLFAAN